MRRMLLPACLLLAATPFSAAAVEACDVPPRFGLSPLAIAIRNTACNEHRLWFRPFIDRDGRAASLSVTEAEGDHLADNGLIAWQRVTSYWRESGTLNALGSQPGASSCLAPLGTRYTDSDCRAFLIDNPWSAAFISWVMVRAGVPGFTTSPRHIDYIRAAYQAGPSGVPYRLVDPATAKPAPGDLLCFLRDRSSTLSYSGLVQALGNGSVGHWKSHCEVVVAANLGGDQTLYLVGGNVMNTVAMRLLQLDRTGTIKLPPPRERDATGIDPTCTPGREDECSFNRQDWAALLQLNATAPRLAPVPSAVPTTPTQMPPQPATEPGSNRGAHAAGSARHSSPSLADRHLTAEAMPTLLFLLIAGGIVYFFWNAARSAAERAIELGRNACRAADVQWLDQAVHATGLRLSRGEDGRLGFERTFKFEYSYDGIDRHVGRMVLRGDQLVSFTGPGAARISQIRADNEDAEDV